MADLRVVARTSACRVAGGLVALEDAGPADALAGRGGRALCNQPPARPLMQRACRAPLGSGLVSLITLIRVLVPASPPSPSIGCPAVTRWGLASVDCRLCALFGCSGRRRAWSTRHGPPSSFQSDVRAPARASKTFGGLCLFSIHDRVPRRDSAEAASAINLATMDCAHFPRSNVVLENWGPPRGVDRSSIRFLRWQLVHQFGPLLLNHLSDIV